MTSLTPKRILMLYAQQGSLDDLRLTIKHHLLVLENSDVKHDITYFNAIAEHSAEPWLWDNDKITPTIPDALQDKEFDVVILHYSFLGYRTIGWHHVKWKQCYDWLADLTCLKIAIPQDEFSQAAILDEWLFDWGIKVIFSTQYRPETPLYPIMRQYAEITRILPGYIDENATQAKTILPIAEREVDIVYRARHLPYWLGKQGQLKYQLADTVKAQAIRQGLNCDISTSEADTITGDRWLDFIASGKTSIGIEGGSSVIDWRGEVKLQIMHLLADKLDSTYEEVSKKMPDGWDSHELFTLTPRHFESIMTRTAQILIEGEYRGILIPNVHYIPLKRDFSNLTECLDKIKDVAYLQQIVDRAYEDIYLSGLYSYKAFAKIINEAIERHMSDEQSLDTNTKEAQVLERQLIRQYNEDTLNRYYDQTSKITDAIHRTGQSLIKVSIVVQITSLIIFWLFLKLTGAL